MEIEKLSGLQSLESENMYLDIGSLVEGVPYEKVALVTSADAGLTKTNSGFARFFLKDKHANIVCARLFDVKDYQNCGVTLAALRNKAVKLKFVPQLYNGSLSLVVDGEFGVQEFKGEFDREAFVGKYKFNEKVINSVGQWSSEQSDWEMPTEWKFSSFSDIGQGRVGSFAKLVELCVGQLKPLVSLDGVDGKKLFQVFFIVMDCYFRKLKARDSLGVIEETKAFNILVGIDSMDYDRELKPIVINCAKPLLGFGQPSHLFSHWISGAVHTAENELEMLSRYNSMIEGASSRIGGVLLSKY